MKPVEYKRGKPKIDERDEVQLCAQVMCLEEMFGIRIDSADFYYNEIRRRQHLAITDDLRSTVRSLADEMHTIFRNGISPEAEAGKELCPLLPCRYLCSETDKEEKSGTELYRETYPGGVCS